MFKLPLSNVVTRSGSYRKVFRGSKNFYHRVVPWKRTYGSGGCTKLLVGVLLSGGTLVTWSTCQGSNLLAEERDNVLVVWGRGLRDVYQDNVVNSSTLRFGRAAYAVVSVIVDYKWTLSGVDPESPEYKEKKSQCHLRSAIRFRDLCSANGGVFMKVGQHIGSLDFLFPKEYTETLKCFQYNAPESSMSDIKYVIETDTAKPLSELFETFDEKPIGSASLAQVHLATLKNGERVAVKVQHKTVKLHAMQDALVIEFFTKVATKMFPEFRFQWLVDQIKKNVPLELDFLNEGQNCERMGTYLEKFPNISVPKIVWKESTQRVLFMEYIAGGAVDDIKYIHDNRLDVNQISDHLGKLYSEMIFVHGDIHCDPHAGNIIVRNWLNGNGVEVILLDHGLYVKMEDDVRLNYCKLWQSMIERDIDGVKKYSEALGVGEYYGLFACMVAGRSWESIQNGIAEKKLTKEELTEIQTGAMDFVSQITMVFENIPRELVLVFKTNDLLRGLDARLQTSAASASFISMSKCCLRAVYEDDYRRCQGFISRCKLSGKFRWNQIRLMLYQMSVNERLSPVVLGKEVVKWTVDCVVNVLTWINSIPGWFSPNVT